MKFQNKHEFATVFFLQCLDIVKMVFTGSTRVVNLCQTCQKYFRLYTVTKLFCTTLDISLDICNCRSQIAIELNLKSDRGKYYTQFTDCRCDRSIFLSFFRFSSIAIELIVDGQSALKT